MPNIQIDTDNFVCQGYITPKWIVIKSFASNLPMYGNTQELRPHINIMFRHTEMPPSELAKWLTKEKIITTPFYIARDLEHGEELILKETDPQNILKKNERKN